MPSPVPTPHAPLRAPALTAPLSSPHDATHARLVSALVHLLFALGFRNIKTAPPRLTTSDTSFTRPDVIARSGQSARALFTVETADSLQSKRATQRLLALATNMDGATLWLAVPPDARPAALSRLRELEIPARVIGI